MTAPRQILEGTTYLITRRCSERRFFLKPSAAVNAIFLYVLAVAAERYEILVHAFCVLSNHVHLVVTDPKARLPEFNRYLDGLVARAVNCALGRWESFWDPDSYSAVRLEDAEAILEKTIYVLANPVAAGLVQHGREWPGLWSDPSRIDGPAIEIQRPKMFFRDGGPMPATAALQLCRPPGFASTSAFVEPVCAGLREAERVAAAELARDGRTFLGAARVRTQKPGARPAPGEPRRALSPRVACRAKWKRIEALQRLRDFVDRYKSALADWRAGLRNAVFPPGTWLMRVQHAAVCSCE